MSYNCWVQIVAYGRNPPLALSATSPMARTVVEHSPQGYNTRYVQLKVQAGPSQTQHCCSFWYELSNPWQSASCCVWWIRRQNLPVALDCPSWNERDEYYRLPFGIQNGGTALPTPTITKFIGAPSFFSLGALRSLTLTQWVMPDLLWLSECPLLEELHLISLAVISGDFSPIATLPSLSVLDIEFCTVVLRTLALHLRSTEWIPRCANLISLTLRNVPEWLDCSHIGAQRALRSIRINPVFNKVSLDWLSACTQLESVIIDNECSGMRSLAQLHHLRVLRMQRLSADACEWLSSCWSASAQKNNLLSWQCLRQIHISSSAIRSIEWLLGCPEVEDLCLDACEFLRDLSPIGALPCLKKLSLKYTKEVFDTTWLAKCTQLEELYMDGFRYLTDPRPFGEIASTLRVLSIPNTASMYSFDLWLSKCTQLRYLDVGYSDVELMRCAFIKGLPLLEKLMLVSYCPRPNDRYYDSYVPSPDNLDGIAGCAHLREVNLCCRMGISDATPLSLLPSLRTLDIRDTGISHIACLAACPVLDKIIFDVDKVKDYSCMENFPSLTCFQVWEVHSSRVADVKACVDNLISSLPSFTITEDSKSVFNGKLKLFEAN